MKRWLGIALAAAALPAWSADALVEAVTPCLEHVRDEADYRTPRMLLTEEGVVTLSPGEWPGAWVPDNCGGLLDQGFKALPQGQTPPDEDAEGLDRRLLTPQWVAQQVAAARAATGSSAAAQRVLLARWYEGEARTIVRVTLADGAKVDLDTAGKPQPRLEDLPDQLEAVSDEDAERFSRPVPIAGVPDGVPTADPKGIFEFLLNRFDLAGDIRVDRLAISDFSVHMYYRPKGGNGATQKVEIDYVRGEYMNPRSGAESYAMWPPCDLTQKQVQRGIAALLKDATYRRTSERLQHALFECHEAGKPMWMLIAHDPFEHANVEVEVGKP